LEVIRFLTVFRREPRNVYQVYHGSQRFDIKKLYRYLRYCLEIRLLEPDRVEQGGFLPAKYYKLTCKGRSLLELFRDFAWETAILSQ
jgi:DNA-binding PadR family transcriptional regulator